MINKMRERERDKEREGEIKGRVEYIVDSKSAFDKNSLYSLFSKLQKRLQTELVSFGCTGGVVPTRGSSPIKRERDVSSSGSSNT